MGNFHCPIGAAAQGTTGCISCGLCTAATKTERLAASERMREYIRSTSEKRGGLIKKIAVCGKGGVGKSTLSALLAKSAVSLGFRTLCIDTDDSNPSMHRRLGVGMEPEPLLTLLERFSDTPKEVDASWLTGDEIRFGDIPGQFVTEKDGLSLMCSGKIDDPLTGCACSMSDLTRILMMNLLPGDNELVIADLEAGVESFGRGMEQGVDTVIIVIEPTLDSLEVAAKIQYMSEGLGIRRVRGILNKVPDRATEKVMLGLLKERGIRYLGTMPMSPEISLAALTGSYISEGEMFEKVKNIACLMFDEAEMDYRI